MNRHKRDVWTGAILTLTGACLAASGFPDGGGILIFIGVIVLL